MSIGELTKTNSHGPYDRYLDVYGIKLLVLPEVSSTFPTKVAQIYDSILSTNVKKYARMYLIFGWKYF